MATTPLHGADWVGRHLDPAAREEWTALVAALRDAAGPGGPLDGWVAHGTTQRRARQSLLRGMTPGPVMVRHDVESGRYSFVPGSHWAIPEVAAFYAEDRAVNDGRRGGGPAFLLARLDDVLACGVPVVDEAGVENPIDTRLGRPFAALMVDWDASAQTWEDCKRILGTFAVHGVPSRRALTLVASAADLAAVLEAQAAPAGPRR